MPSAKQPLLVAIDGPAGAGKSTVAREVARRLDFVLVDTGAVYRSVGLLALDAGLPVDDEAALAPIVHELDIAFAFADDINRVIVRGKDVTQELRSEAVSRAAATLSTLPQVRAGLLALQRRLAGEQDAVLEGRDIGTVVCPDAQVKVFLHASLQERARRRHEELLQRGEHLSLAQVIDDMEIRDASDVQRKHAPLRAAPDAMMLDCTLMEVEAVIGRIVERVVFLRPELMARASVSSRPPA